jgi:hypothetical protein
VRRGALQPDFDYLFYCFIARTVNVFWRKQAREF